MILPSKHKFRWVVLKLLGYRLQANNENQMTFQSEDDDTCVCFSRDGKIWVVTRQDVRDALRPYDGII